MQELKQELKEQIEEFYKKFEIDLQVSNIIDTYSITRYFLELDKNSTTRIAKIEKLTEDLAVFLGIKNIRYTRDYATGGIVLEIPKEQRNILQYKEIEAQATDKGISICFGKDLNNNDLMVDLCTTPHLLVAGTTGSGKSCFINSIISQIIEKYPYQKVKLSLIDPKRVELSKYKNAKHVAEFADNTESARAILTRALIEIEERYQYIEEKGLRDMKEYYKSNYCAPGLMFYKFIIIDEVADLLLQDKKTNKRRLDTKELSIENLIVRIAQIGRACGVHLIIATQRPSSDIITGLIKANVPSRVALSVSTKVDSRVILDTAGAEKLLGNGDALVKIIGNDEIVRIQAPYITNQEIDEIIEKHKKEPIKAEPQQQKPQPKKHKLTEEEKRARDEKIENGLMNFFYLFFTFISSPIGIIIILLGVFIWGYFKFAQPILG